MIKAAVNPTVETLGDTHLLRFFTFCLALHCPFLGSSPFNWNIHVTHASSFSDAARAFSTTSTGIDLTSGNCVVLYGKGCAAAHI